MDVNLISHPNGHLAHNIDLFSNFSFSLTKQKCALDFLDEFLALGDFDVLLFQLFLFSV